MATVTSPNGQTSRDSLCNVHPVSPDVERSVLEIFERMQQEADQRWTIAEPGPSPRGVTIRVAMLAARGRTLRQIVSELKINPISVRFIFRRLADTRQTPVSMLRRMFRGSELSDDALEPLIRAEWVKGKAWQEYRRRISPEV